MSPADLFASIEECHAKRLAIMAEAGVENQEERAEADRHACEVKAVMRQCYPDGQKAAEYMHEVEKKRGKEAADRLRDDVRAAWKKRRIEEAGQA